MKRNPDNYNMMLKGVPVPMSQASREELEADLMRAYDLIRTLEERMEPLMLVLDRFIAGRDKLFEKSLAEINADPKSDGNPEGDAVE